MNSLPNTQWTDPRVRLGFWVLGRRRFLLGIFDVRAFITAIVVFVGAAAEAMTPEYDSSRRCVEQNNPADKTPATARVFVVYSTNSFILRFHKAMSLREIVDATPLKRKSVTVYILRESQKTKPVFDETVEPSAKPSFQVRPRDLLFIHIANGAPRW